MREMKERNRWRKEQQNRDESKKEQKQAARTRRALGEIRNKQVKTDPYYHSLPPPPTAPPPLPPLKTGIKQRGQGKKGLKDRK